MALNHRRKDDRNGRMTNEELIHAYYGGDKSALSLLYSQNIGFLKSTAMVLMRNAGIVNISDNTGYSDEMLEELVQVGSETMLRVLSRKEYNQNIAKFTTYLFPYIRGAMLEHIRNFHNLNTEPLTVTVEDEYGIEEIQNPKIAVNTTNPERSVYRKLCMALLERLFQQLSAKDRQIIGNSFGVYGYDRLSLGDISTIEMLSKDAIIKNRSKALDKLAVLYPGSKLAVWMEAYHAVLNTLCQK